MDAGYCVTGLSGAARSRCVCRAPPRSGRAERRTTSACERRAPSSRRAKPRIATASSSRRSHSFCARTSSRLRAELEFDLGRIYERLGEADDAITHFRAYLTRAELRADEREQIEARIANLIALRARQRAPLIASPPARSALTAEARAFFERGAKLFRRGRYEAALVAFSAARRFAELPELTYNLAVTSERLERWDDAIAYYRAYLREAKDAADAEQIEARIRVPRQPPLRARDDRVPDGATPHTERPHRSMEPTSAVLLELTRTLVSSLDFQEILYILVSRIAEVVRGRPRVDRARAGRGRRRLRRRGQRRPEAHQPASSTWPSIRRSATR